MLTLMQTTPLYEYMVLSPAQAEHHWPVIRELLAKAVDHGRGEVEVDDILVLAQSRKMFVVALMEDDRIVAALAAEVLAYPRKSVLNVAFLGGTGVAARSAQLIQFLDASARLLKASAVRCMCRESVARLAVRREPSVVRAYVVLEREVPQ